MIAVDDPAGGPAGAVGAEEGVGEGSYSPRGPARARAIAVQKAGGPGGPIGAEKSPPLGPLPAPAGAALGGSGRGGGAHGGGFRERMTSGGGVKAAGPSACELRVKSNIRGEGVFTHEKGLEEANDPEKIYKLNSSQSQSTPEKLKCFWKSMIGGGTRKGCGGLKDILLDLEISKHLITSKPFHNPLCPSSEVGSSVDGAEDASMRSSEALHACTLGNSSTEVRPPLISFTFRGKARIKIPRAPKGPTGKKTPGPIPRVVVTAAGVVSAYEYLKRKLKQMGFLKLAIFTIASVMITRSVLKRRKAYNSLRISEPFIGRVILVTGHDIFHHDRSRRSLVKLIKEGGLEAIIPLCVMELLELDMEVGARPSLLAFAPFKMIKKLLEHGYTTCQEREHWYLENGNMSLHDDRLLNCAYGLSLLNLEAKVFVVTNSNSIRNEAKRRDIRCATTDMLLRWTEV